MFLQHELPVQLPAALNDSTRRLALQIMVLLRIPLPEDRWVPIARQRTLGIGQCASRARKNAA